MLHEIDTITPGNIRRICIVREHLRKAGMLSVGDAERLFGFPQGWTEPCTQLRAPSEEPCRKTRPYACNESLHRYNQIEEGITKWRTAFGASIPATCTSHRGRYVENGSKENCRTGFSAEKILEEGLHSIHADERQRCTSTKIETCVGALDTQGDEQGCILGGIGLPSRSPKAAEIDVTIDPGTLRKQPTSETEYSGSERGDDDMQLNADEADDIARILMLASASAVPDARWIGQRLNNPCALKFECEQLGTPFSKEIPGGLDDPEGRVWPEAAWNIHPYGQYTQQDIETVWKGRRALRDWSDMPVRLPFVPLGDFLLHEGVAPSVNATASYIAALQIANTDIPHFVMRALDPDGDTATQEITHHAEDKPHCEDLIRLENLADLASAEPSLVTQGDHRDTVRASFVGKIEDGGSNHGGSGTGSVDILHSTVFLESKKYDEEEQGLGDSIRREFCELLLSGDEDENNRDDPLMAGRPVWAPWRLGKGVEQVLWPGISLHREEHKHIIPDAALKIKVKGATADSHKLVIFFGDRTFQWLPSSSLSTFRDLNFEDCMAQNVRRHTASFQRACQEARIWTRTWRKLKFRDEQRKQGRCKHENVTELSGPTVTAVARYHAGLNNRIKKFGYTRKGEWNTGLTPKPSMNLSEGKGIPIPHKERSGLFGVDSFGPFGYTGSLASAAEPEPCGVCKICQSRAQVLDGTTVKTTYRAAHRHLKCPQVSAVRVARTGHAGALLALRREGAVGQRIKIMMGENNQFCRGSVCMFHGDCFSHDVELDSGEYVTGIRLWNESVQVIDPETTSRPARHFTSVGKSFHHGKYVAKPAGFLKRNKEEACAKMQSAKRRAIHFHHEANALSTVQRCESCSRSHKSIAYCISRGHITGLAGNVADAYNSTVRGTDAKTEFVPRTAARRGGNGKFVVSESVGTALATAGVEIPERCALCIRRKKGLAHCLKKGHIAGAETAAGLILPATDPPKPPKSSSTFFARTSAAGSAPPIEQHAESVTLANTAGHDADLLAHGISTSVKVARIDSAKAQAAAAAAMADAFARAAANAPLPDAL